MRGRRLYVSLIVVAAVALIAEISGQGQGPAPRKTAYRAPRTAWGTPDLHGDYTNKDEANTPLERPMPLAQRGPGTFTQAELTQLAKERAEAAERFAGAIGGAETGAGPTHWYDFHGIVGSRPWFITDPADGQLPPMTPQAQRREAAVALLNDARNGE